MSGINPSMSKTTSSSNAIRPSETKTVAQSNAIKGNNNASVSGITTDLRGLYQDVNFNEIERRGRDELEGMKTPFRSFENDFKKWSGKYKSDFMESLIVNEMIKSMIAFEIESFNKFKKDKIGEDFDKNKYDNISNFLDTIETGKYLKNDDTNREIQKASGILFGELEKLLVRKATRGKITNPYNITEALQGQLDLGWLLDGGAKQITDEVGNLSKKYGGRIGNLLRNIDEGIAETFEAGAKGFSETLEKLAPIVEKGTGKILSYIGVPDAVLSVIDAIALGIDEGTGGYRAKNHDLGDAQWMENIPVIGEIITISETINDAMDSLIGTPTDKQAVLNIEKKLKEGWDKIIKIHDENYNKIANDEAELEKLAVDVSNLTAQEQIESEVFKIADSFIKKVKEARGDTYKLTEGDITELTDRIQKYEEKHFNLPTGEESLNFVKNTIKNVIGFIEDQDKVEKEKIRREDLFKDVPAIVPSQLNLYDLRGRNISDHQNALVEEMSRLKKLADDLSSLATAKDIESFADAGMGLTGRDTFGSLKADEAKREAEKAREQHNKIVSEILPDLESTASKLKTEFEQLKQEAKKNGFNKLFSTIDRIPTYSKQMLREQDVYNPFIDPFFMGDDDGGVWIDGFFG